MKIFLLLSILLSFPLAAHAAPQAGSELAQKFSSLPSHGVERIAQTPVIVGQAVDLRVDKGQPDWKIDLPPDADDLIDQGWDLEPGPSAPGEKRFRAVPTKAGHLSLPSLLIRDKTGAPIARTSPLEIDAGSAISPQDPHPAEPAQVKPPVGLKFPVWAVAALCALALGALGFLLYLLKKMWDRRRKKAAPAPVTRKKSEDEIALEKLAALEAQGYWRNAQYKPHYFRLSEIVKDYVGARYGFDAAESTSREMIAQLRSLVSADPQLILPLEELFEKLDRVKFTDFMPENPEPEALLKAARNWVYRTRKPVAPTVSEGSVRASS